MAAKDSPNPRGPNCWQCRFFAISWDPRMPYACQRLGFKSPVMPAIEVLRTDGQHCLGFSPKDHAPVPAPSGSDPSNAMQPSTRVTSTRLWQA
ncbi:MAG: hypothetical protein ACKOFG_03785 [Limnohabitans sp.]